MDSQKTSILRIVGAGPGDPDLITVKGLKAIREADVILYDALVNEELLRQRKEECKLVYVGKRKGKKEFSQDEINQLIVFYAGRYGSIVRLKGGDPYVFGRGHEELEYAARRGVRTEVIPGISSAIAAPAAAGIPLTKRGVNESFWVITGMLADGTFSRDLEFAAQSSATVVIVMGMTHISHIMELFSQHRAPSEPVAVIQHATWPQQKTAYGTVSTITGAIREQALQAPAVIVVGKVVDEHTVAEILASDQVKVKAAV